MNRLTIGAVWRRARPIHVCFEPCTLRVGVQQAFHTAPSLRLRDGDEEIEFPTPKSEPKSDHDESKDTSKADTDTLDFSSIFDLLKLPKGVGQQPPKASERMTDRDSHSSTDPDEDPGIEDLLSAIDKNAASRGSSRRQPDTADRRRLEDDSDPMAEFERILSDLAAKDTEVYKRSRPAPLFWNEGGESGEGVEGGRRAKFIDDLEPESLFKPGPRSSAFSAGSLTSDSRRISGTASRILKLSSEARLAQDHRSLADSRDGRTSKVMGAQLSRRELDIEQVQLSRLSQCQSASALSNFIYSQLVATKDTQDVRPSPLVFTETIRVARELQSPYTAYFIYNYCRTSMSLIDKLNVLNVSFYEELLTTAWTSLRDISAVVSIIQDAISLGVISDERLEAQIGLIIIELHKIYDMPSTANQISELRGKMSAQRSSEAAMPLIAQKAEIAKSQYSL
ncbi:hypothetical protein H4218_000820 [Coemansia sp. IMI 209128]|nr:hypothetical protein H4218_000820 [Coemansia sp. IMI 209128]